LLRPFAQQFFQEVLDSRFRGNDKVGVFFKALLVVDIPGIKYTVPRITLIVRMTRTLVLRFNGEAEAQLCKHPIECAELRVASL
jgi:hypothetical protein